MKRKRGVMTPSQLSVWTADVSKQQKPALSSSFAFSLDVDSSNLSREKLQQLALVVAYRRYLQRTPLVRRKRSHECSAECTWLGMEQDVYVCSLSGNVHRCTCYLCDRLVSEVDANICELTGRSYDIGQESPVGVDGAVNSKWSAFGLGDDECDPDHPSSSVPTPTVDIVPTATTITTTVLPPPLVVSFDEVSKPERPLKRAKQCVPSDGIEDKRKEGDEKKRRTKSKKSTTRIDPNQWVVLSRDVISHTVDSLSDREPTAVLCTRLWMKITKGHSSGPRAITAFQQHCRAVATLRAKGGITRPDGTVVLPRGDLSYRLKRCKTGRAATLTVPIALLQRSLSQLSSDEFRT